MRWKKGIAACLACMILCASMLAEAVCVYGESTEDKTLKVGYIDYTGFIDEKNGTYSGYGVDYLNEISTYTGYQFEYYYGNWTENLKKLENQEIDLICTAQYTDERAEVFEYSKSPIGYTQGLLYTLPDSNLVYEDFEYYDGMKVAVLKNNAMNGLFEQYAADNHFTYEPVEYENTMECVNAMENGEVDAMVSESLFYNTELKLLADFGADPFYIVSYQGNDCMKSINYALGEIKRDETFDADLFQKYYGDSVVATAAEFTKEERNYIEQAGTIVVGCIGNRAPCFSINEETGEPEGICVDILKEIAQISGLQIEFRELTGKPSNAVKDERYDIIAGVEATNFEGNADVLLSNVVTEADIVPVVREDNTDLDLNNGNRSVAIPENFEALQNYIVENYPNMEIIRFSTNKACMDAVRSGHVDAFFQNTMLISELMKSPYYENMVVLPIKIMEEKDAIIAEHNEENEILMSIINKSLYAMDESVKQSIIINNTDAVQYRLTPGEFFYKYKRSMIPIVVLFLACIGLLCFIIYLRRRNEMKLQEANHYLQQANYAKTSFLSRVSHDIRTPMNSIIGMTALAYDDLDYREKIKDDLDKISSASKFLLGLINDVLDMSKIESGELQLKEEHYYYSELVRDIDIMIRPICEEKGVIFILEKQDLDAHVMVDKLRINQIFFNLLSNAVKFTPTGGTVRIYMNKIVRSGDHVCGNVVVEDTGIGMTKEYMKHLYEPFSQEDNKLTNNQQGTGLGLSIVKSLVDQMGGSIEIDSEPGRGTRVSVYLELKLAEDVTENQSRNEQKEQNKTLRGKRVLVVEDHPLNAQIAQRILEKWEMEVTLAEDGQQAVKQFQVKEEGYFDMILMDIRMPVMNGLQATETIRKMDDSDAGTIPIIAMTADAFSEDMQIARDAGMDEFLSKPIEPKKLEEVLMRFA